jgi:hypothetical protein
MMTLRAPATSLFLLQMLSHILGGTPKLTCGCPNSICTLDNTPNLLDCDVVNGDIELDPKAGVTELSMKATSIIGELTINPLPFPDGGDMVTLNAPNLLFVNGSIQLQQSNYKIVAPNMNCFGGPSRLWRQELGIYGTGKLNLEIGSKSAGGVHVVGGLGSPYKSHSLDISKANIKSIAGSIYSPAFFTDSTDGVMSLPKLEAIEGYCDPTKSYQPCADAIKLEKIWGVDYGVKRLDFPALVYLGGVGITLKSFVEDDENTAPIINMMTLKSLGSATARELDQLVHIISQGDGDGGLSKMNVGSVKGFSKNAYICGRDDDIAAYCNGPAPPAFVRSCIDYNKKDGPVGPDGPDGPSGPGGSDGVSPGIIVAIIVGCCIFAVIGIFVLYKKGYLGAKKDPREFVEVNEAVNDYIPPTGGSV